MIAAAPEQPGELLPQAQALSGRRTACWKDHVRSSNQALQIQQLQPFGRADRALGWGPRRPQEQVVAGVQMPGLHDRDRVQQRYVHHESEQEPEQEQRGRLGRERDESGFDAVQTVRQS